MGIHIFFTAVWNGMQITRGSEYRHAIHRVSIFNLHYFISHFVLHSLLMVAYIRMEKKTSFFLSLVNFGSGWTARAKLLLSVLT